MSETRVIYDSKRLIPAPYVSINKSYQKDGNGDIIGKIYNITISGTLVAWMGSPKSDGSFYAKGGYPANESLSADDRLEAIQRKQEAIRDLFSTEGLSFEVQAANAMSPVRCYPRINGISFSEGQWFDKCSYTIELECDELYPKQEDDFSEYISNANESWSIETDEQPESLHLPRTYRLSHEISATGKKIYNSVGSVPKEAWEQARDYVLNRLGFDEVVASSSGVHDLPDYYGGWNHMRSSNPDVGGGSYSVTETWVLASGSALEDWTIEIEDELSSPYKNVSIEGEITGLEKRDSNMNVISTKWDNAQSKFNQASGVAFTRAQTHSDYNLNIQPINQTIGKNPFQGVINYSFEYNDRPMNLISGVLEESISINDNIGGELFASVFVLGRSEGPVLQDLGTKKESSRNLSIEIVIPVPELSDRSQSSIQDVLLTQKPSNTSSPYYDDVNNVISAVNPENNGYSTVFQEQPQETWNYREGHFSYSTRWIYE